MHLPRGERKHSTAVPLIGRVVLIHEEIDNRDGLAAVAVVATTTTTTTTVEATVAAAAAVVAAAAGKQEAKAE